MASNKINPSYLDTLKERQTQSRIYKKYQLIGLLIARLLDDEKHKSLYIKLCKTQGEEKLLSIAKDIAERGLVKNKGAYFMGILKRLGTKKQKLKIKKGNKHSAKTKNEKIEK